MRKRAYRLTTSAHMACMILWGCTDRPASRRSSSGRRCRYRSILRILNPTMAIEVALEACRDNESGYGPQKLAALAAYALRTGLLSFLTTVQVRSCRVPLTHSWDAP